MTTKTKIEAPKVAAHRTQYTARIGCSEYSVKMVIERPAGIRFTLTDERMRSARVFQIAAALEIKAAELGRTWPVCPSASDGQIKIECDRHEMQEAAELIDAACLANDVILVVR